MQTRDGIEIGRCFYDPALDQALEEVHYCQTPDEFCTALAAWLTPLRPDVDRYTLWYNQLTAAAANYIGTETLLPWAQELNDTNHRGIVVDLLYAADIFRQVAWEIRGNGYGADLSEEQLNSFAVLNAAAHRVLDLAHPLDEHNPTLWATKIGLLCDVDGRKAVTMIDDAFELFPTNFAVLSEIYRAKLPRWGGQPGELEDFCVRAAQANPTSVAITLLLDFLREEYQEFFWATAEEKGVWKSMTAPFRSMRLESKQLKKHGNLLHSAAKGAVQNSRNGLGGAYDWMIHQCWFFFWRSRVENDHAAQHEPFLGHRFYPGTCADDEDKAFEYFAKARAKR